MKFVFALLAVCMLGGCGMRNADIPMPSEMPTIMPTETATGAPVALGTFYTDILDGDAARVQNLQLCAAALHGTKIDAGAEFSFNTAVGERTSEKGYREAIMLVDGEREMAVGGGVCQIASTLYNAAAAAGMEILERHDHTGDVHYVEIGQDAAVSYGEQDFRFRNPLKEPIQIGITIENMKVSVTIYKI